MVRVPNKIEVKPPKPKEYGDIDIPRETLGKMKDWVEEQEFPDSEEINHRNPDEESLRLTTEIDDCFIVLENYKTNIVQISRDYRITQLKVPDFLEL